MQEVDWFFEMLETSNKASDIIDLVKYLLYKATGVNLGVTSMGNLIVSAMIPTKTVGMDYIVDTTQSGEQTIVTDFEELRKALSTYNSQLSSHTQAYLNMQQKYNVNAVFAAAVAVIETGGGTTGNATNSSNNWYNIKGGSGWAQYGSSAESIDAFGKLIKNNYFSKGKYTVSTIGGTYCPSTEADPTAAETWTKNVVAQMTYFYKVLGITISGNDMIGDEVQSNIVEVATNSAKYGIPAEGGYCLAWVRNVYIKAGAPYYASCCCARHAGYYYGVSTDWSEIPVGALVFGHSRTANGILYGHVGIYIGNNTVAHNTGKVQTTSLTDWINTYPGVGWGWCSTTPVLAQYPVNSGLLSALLNTAHTTNVSVSPK